MSASQSHQNHPQPHVFPVVSERNHRQRNECVARAFCEAYGKQYGASAGFVEAEVDNIDAVVKIDGQEIVLELAAYRQQDEYIGCEIADSEIRGQISASLARVGLDRIQIHVGWQKAPLRRRRKGMSPLVADVPRGTDAKKFCSEFVAFARFVLDRPHPIGRNVLFRSDEQVEQVKRRHPSEPMVSEKLFPVVSKHCGNVRLELSERSVAPYIRTSADARHLGFDEVQLDNTVSKHLKKLPEYRTRAKGRPVWLVIHSDGWPTSARLHELERQKAIAAIANTLGKSGGRFDRVWWAEDTISPSNAQIFPVKQDRGVP